MIPAYVSQKDLAAWRDSNKPSCCPLFGHKDFDPVVDHDHDTGRIRGVVDRQANVFLGKIENAYKRYSGKSDASLQEILDNIIEYLWQDQGPYHPKGILSLQRRFLQLPVKEQRIILKSYGATEEERYSKSPEVRQKAYRRQLLHHMKRQLNVEPT